APRARRAAGAAGAAPVLLEELQVGAGPAPGQRGPARLLGVQWLQHVWRPMARTALLGRLAWQLGEVAELVQETPRVASLVLDVPEWPGHPAGQHVDVRLTADDGYQAERSYSIASAPED